mgnify:CR=1 FL=1
MNFILMVHVYNDFLLFCKFFFDTNPIKYSSYLESYTSLPSASCEFTLKKSKNCQGIPGPQKMVIEHSLTVGCVTFLWKLSRFSMHVLYIPDLLSAPNVIFSKTNISTGQKTKHEFTAFRFTLDHKKLFYDFCLDSEINKYTSTNIVCILDGLLPYELTYFIFEIQKCIPSLIFD